MSTPIAEEPAAGSKPSSAEACAAPAKADETSAKAPTVMSCSIARDRTMVEEYRARITKIYTEKQPTKVDEIEKFLEKYRGQEHTLYLKICKKYSVPEEPEYRGNSPFGGGLSALGKKAPDAFALGTALFCKKEDSGSLPVASLAASPPSIPARVACSVESKVKPLLSTSGAAVSSGAPCTSKLLVEASAPSQGQAGGLLPSVRSARPLQTERVVDNGGTVGRSRSRSPKEKQTKQTVWVVTCHCDSPQKHFVQAVRSSKDSAKTVADRAMEQQKTDLGSDKEFGNLMPATAAASLEEVTCGFTFKSSKADGTEGLVGSYSWLVSSHAVE